MRNIEVIILKLMTNCIQKVRVRKDKALTCETRKKAMSMTG